MPRVLSIVSNNIESGGVESYLLNAYKNIDLAGITIDLVAPGRVVYQRNASEFEKLGCNIITLGITEGPKRILKLYHGFRIIMMKGHYDLVHVNTGNLTIEAIALKCAKNAHIPVRIAHSHGTVYISGHIQEKVRDILRSIINKNATHKLACSLSAAEALFGKKMINDVIIAPNGIDAHKYVYDVNLREQVRKGQNWVGKYVIGSVGRLAPEKNYSFLLKIFKRVKSLDQDSHLVLIGDGEEKSSLIGEASDLGIENDIEFLGVREDVPALLQGLDVFSLVSKREALGIVNIEAQASGLPCVVSDVIPKDIDLNGKVSFLSLSEDPDTWARELLKYKGDYKREDGTELIITKGYDFSTSYKVLEEIYQNIYRSQN